MKSLNCKVTVANVDLFTNEEGRQYITLVINEQIPARRLDKTTGEFVQTFSNDIKMPLKKFMHIVFFETATMMQYYLAPKDRGYYKTMAQSEYYNLLVGATLNVEIQRFEDGESFINDIVLSDFGNDFGFGAPKDMTKMLAIIKAANQARGKKFDFAAEKAADKADVATAE